MRTVREFHSGSILDRDILSKGTIVADTIVHSSGTDLRIAVAAFGTIAFEAAWDGVDRD